MKQLLVGIVVILVIGIGAFFYRNAVERPHGTPAVACDTDAKMCPDGSSVGRTGPSCTFAACAFPNIEIPSLSISFVVPNGFTENKAALGQDATLAAVFDSPSKGDVPNSIVVRSYPIPEGKTGNDVILAETMYESSSMQPKSMSEFKPVIIQGKTFQSVVLERFEGQIHSAYYLVRQSDVLRFEVLEKDVDWTNPSLDIPSLPAHKALLSMLGTLMTR